VRFFINKPAFKTDMSLICVTNYIHYKLGAIIIIISGKDWKKRKRRKENRLFVSSRDK